MTFAEASSEGVGRRLQLILLLMLIWDVLAVAAELQFGGPLFKVRDDEVTGLLAAKGSFSGAAIVPICLYLYAIVRGPLKHRAVLWAAAIEQGAAVAFAIFHVGAGDLPFEAVLATLVVSLVLLVTLLINVPRQWSGVA